MSLARSHVMSVLVLASLSLAAAAPRVAHVREQTRMRPTAETLASGFFKGTWVCTGGTPAGRRMSSDVVFTAVLGGRFLQSRHVDRAPGRYESISLWPDSMTTPFTTVVYDNFGGTRRFVGEAASPRAVTLLRDTLEAGARLESFTYRATSDSTYRYAWNVRRAAGQAMVLGDSATCRRA